MIGKTLEHYQITSQSGRGGKSEVDRAEGIELIRQLGFLSCLCDATGTYGFLHQTLSQRRI